MERPNYYAVIPAEVRYDPDLRPNEKLLFGEITALATKEGFCWATNDYFSQLYGVSIQTISEWINHLKMKKYIEVEIERKGKTVTQRRIGIREKPKGYSEKAEEGYSAFSEKGIQKKPKENNTSINNTSINNKREIYKEKYGEFGNVLLSDDELEKLKERYPSTWEAKIENLSEYIASKGVKYKSHYATILNWARKNNGKDVERKELGKVWK